MSTGHFLNAPPSLRWLVACISPDGFRFRYVPCFLSGIRTIPLPAYHPRLPNLCSSPPDGKPALRFFGSILVQSSHSSCFFCSVPLITRLPVSGSLLHLEHPNVQPFTALCDLQVYLSPGAWLVSAATMASADFSPVENRPVRPPLVRASSFLQCLRHLLMNDFEILGRYKGVLAYPHSLASYAFPVRQYRILQSRFLQCKGHP